MKYYFAPLEGITGYVYRNAHHKFFPGTDRYYTPFVAPNYTKHFKTKEKRDVAPENNAGVPLVPQVLSNKADETLWAVEELARLGYEEVNLNLGCPMPTVARKKKGSGLLKFTEAGRLPGRRLRGDRAAAVGPSPGQNLGQDAAGHGQHAGGGRAGPHLQPLSDQRADRPPQKPERPLQRRTGPGSIPPCLAKQCQPHNLQRKPQLRG